VVTSKDGTHTFTDSYQEFLKLKEKAQRAGLA
jgi:cell division protein YceG involved in septum cleavage